MPVRTAGQRRLHYVVRGRTPLRPSEKRNARECGRSGSWRYLARRIPRAPRLASGHRSARGSAAWTRRDSNPHLQNGKSWRATSYTTGPAPRATLARRARNSLKGNSRRDARASSRIRCDFHEHLLLTVFAPTQPPHAPRTPSRASRASPPSTRAGRARARRCAGAGCRRRRGRWRSTSRRTRRGPQRRR